MSKFRDYTGSVFGKWTVLKRDETKQKQWLCKCSCGTIASVNIDNLKSGRSQNCQKCHGSKTKERMSIHGESKTRLYAVWLAMRNRCNKPTVKGYKNYGGRGIKVCNEWMKSYKNFRDWSLENGYATNLQIDRIDNDGDYSPQNCRWVTRLENMQNTRLNKKVFWNGEWITRTELSIKTGVSKRIIGERLRRGWTIEETIYYTPQLGNNQTLRGDIYGQYENI